MNINKKRRKLPKLKGGAKRHKTVERLVLTFLSNIILWMFPNYRIYRPLERDC